MANTDYQSVPEYIAAQPKPTQLALKKLRAIIRKGLPKADEVISYQIAAYKLDGAPVIYFSGWKNHVSLHPATGAMNEVLGEKLDPYKTGKGTLQFPLDEPLPVKLIERVVKIRLKETLDRQKAKPKK
jgi:uncharacterized protein YdhG (YjbR/CyaY superfamily)